MLVSAVYHSESAIHIHTSPYLLPLAFPSHPPYPTTLGGHKAPSWSPCAMCLPIFNSPDFLRQWVSRREGGLCSSPPLLFLLPPFPLSPPVLLSFPPSPPLPFLPPASPFLIYYTPITVFHKHNILIDSVDFHIVNTLKSSRMGQKLSQFCPEGALLIWFV